MAFKFRLVQHVSCLLLIGALAGPAAHGMLYLAFNNSDESFFIPPGEGTGPVFEGLTRISSASFGGSRPVDLGDLQNRPRTSLSTLTISKKMSTVSVPLFNSMQSGLPIKGAELRYYESGVDSTDLIFTARLGESYVSSMNFSGGSDSQISETVSFEFAQVLLQYNDDKDGPGAGTSRYYAYYDVVSGARFGGDSLPKPTVNAPPPQSVLVNSTDNSFTFSFSDPLEAIATTSVTVSSLSEGLIPSGSIEVTGSGETRSVAFDTTSAEGTAQLQLTVNNGYTSTSEQVTVHILAPAAPPEIHAPASLYACLGNMEPFRGLSLSDPDTATGLTLILTTALGNLTLATDIPGGLTAGQITGNGTSSVTVSAPLNAINRTLNDRFGLVYEPLSLFPSPLTLEAFDNDPDEPQSDSATVPILLLADPFICWQYQEFPAAAVTGSLKTAEFDDFDLDGVINLIEYGLGLDAGDASSVQPMEISIHTQGSDRFLQISYLRRRGASDVTVRFELYNAALDQWTINPSFNAVGAPVSVNAKFDRVTFRATNPVEETGSLVRLLVTRTVP
jgi:type VI protein secretion system component Hcp